MYRTHTNGELRLSDAGKQVTLAGWVQRTRKMGALTFVDLRDRYGITQLVFNEETNAPLCERANKLGREFVIQVNGTVAERYSKNKNIPTGDIEIEVSELNVLNESITPPFTIEDNSDGGDDLRMKYRYLDLRRNAVRKNLELRHKFCIAVRNYLSNLGFLEVETPMLIGSTPEGARDFIVPSRMNASVMKTCALTVSQSSHRSTARCRLSLRRTSSRPSREWQNTCSRSCAAWRLKATSSVCLGLNV